MRLSQRFTLAWRVLTTSQQKAVATMIPSWLENTPTYNQVNFETMVRDGWRKNELIFSCIDKTANTSSQVGLQVLNKSTDKPLPDHPLKKLIQRPNPVMNEFDFWSAVILFQKLGGRAIFEKVRSRAGKVVQLWPLRPDWIEPLQTSAGTPGGYRYTVPGLDSEDLLPDDVLDFKLFDPLSLYSGWPPAAVAGRVGDVDNAVTDYLKLFFQHGGVPPGLLKSKQTLVDAQVADIRRRWRERYGGYQHWLEPAVLDADAEYQKTGLSFTEMGFDVLDARDEARICMVLRVPPILIGAKIGLDRATYSNYMEARRAWWQDDLIPLYQNYIDVLDNGLVREFDQNDSVACSFDFSKVPALQEERKSQWSIAVGALTAGGITVNEFCKEVGLEDKGPAGEYYLRSSSTVEVPVKDGVRPAAPASPAPAAAQPASQPMMNDDDEGDNVEPSEEDYYLVPDQHGTLIRIYAPQLSKADPPPDAAIRRKHERIVKAAMEEYFAGQLKRIKKELRSNGNQTG